MSKASFASTLKEILKTQERTSTPLTPDDLDELRTNRCSAEQMEEKLELAMVSSNSVQALLDTRDFPDVEPKAPEQGVTETETAEAWDRFRSNLPRGGADSLPDESDRERNFFTSRRFAQIAAALLLVSNLGIAGLLLRAAQPAEIEPRSNREIVELTPETERAEHFILSLSKQSSGLLLVLATIETRSFESYEAVILNAEDSEVWSSQELVRVRGLLTIDIPRSFLSSGIYRIQLHGLEGGHREWLATYAIEIGG